MKNAAAFDFASQVAQASRPGNWVRAVDPANEEHHIAEGGWQGCYNARFIDRLDPNTQAVLGYSLIWGAPKHNMRQFYDELAAEWSDLPGFEHFRKAVAGKKKMVNFRVHTTPNIELTRLRCPLYSLDYPARAPAEATATSDFDCARALGAQQVILGFLNTSIRSSLRICQPDPPLFPWWRVVERSARAWLWLRRRSMRWQPRLPTSKG